MNRYATHVCVFIFILSCSTRHCRRRRRDSYDLISDVVVGHSSSLEAAARALPMEEEEEGDGDGDGESEPKSFLVVLFSMFKCSRTRSSVRSEEMPPSSKRTHITQPLFTCTHECSLIHSSPPFHPKKHTRACTHTAPVAVVPLTAYTSWSKAQAWVPAWAHALPLPMV